MISCAKCLSSFPFPNQKAQTGTAETFRNHLCNAGIHTALQHLVSRGNRVKRGVFRQGGHSKGDACEQIGLYTMMGNDTCL